MCVCVCGGGGGGGGGEVGHIICIRGYALHSSRNNYIPNLNSLIPTSTYTPKVNLKCQCYIWGVCKVGVSRKRFSFDRILVGGPGVRCSVHGVECMNC